MIYNVHTRNQPIDKYNGNNVSIDSALKLKSYTTTQRNSLTSVAGDVIYNTTESKPQFYDGSAWENLGSTSFDLHYLIIAGGGGAGSSLGGGGGAGGYRTS